MVWRNAVKVVLAAGEAVGRAFTRAVKEEIKASQQAAQRHAASSGGASSSEDTRVHGNTNAKLGISLQESIQILNVREPLDAEQVKKNYDHLFAINDKAKGGSFYIQAKVYRAKERVDEELKRLAGAESAEEAKPSSAAAPEPEKEEREKKRENQ